MALNLLPKDLQEEKKKDKQQKLSNIISILVLVLLVLVMVGLFAYRLVLSRRLNEINSSLAEVSTQVAKQQAVEGTLKSINLKLNKFKQVSEKSYSYGTVLEDIVSVAGDQVRIAGARVEKQNQFEITGETDSLSKLATFMGGIKGNTQNYSQLRLSKINFNPNDFNYRFVVNFLYQLAQEKEIK